MQVCFFFPYEFNHLTSCRSVQIYLFMINNNYSILTNAFHWLCNVTFTTNLCSKSIIYLSVHLFIYLSSTYLSVYLCIYHISVYLFAYFCRAWDGTQVIVYARQALYYGAVSSLILFYLPYFWIKNVIKDAQGTQEIAECIASGNTAEGSGPLHMHLKIWVLNHLEWNLLAEQGFSFIFSKFQLPRWVGDFPQDWAVDDQMRWSWVLGMMATNASWVSKKGWCEGRNS
jgi:hypothetical protein